MVSEADLFKLVTVNLVTTFYSTWGEKTELLYDLLWQRQDQVIIQETGNYCHWQKGFYTRIMFNLKEN